MENNVTAAKLTLTGAIAAGTALWGWFGWLVLLWILAMAMDYTTGTMAAIKNREWSSKTAREGLWHKGGMIAVVLAAMLTDFAVSLILQSGVFRFPFDHSTLLSVIVLSWYTLTELGSSLENATKLTSKVPSWLSRFLKSAAETVDKTGGQLAGEDDDA